ncbi:MAG: hypothetical protein QW096_09785, partial [Thermofilaceae archaeon]
MKEGVKRSLSKNIVTAVIFSIFVFSGFFSYLIYAAGTVGISIIVPQPAYPLGSRVVVYARVTMGGAPYPGAVVLWELKDPQGIRKDFGQATTNATGYATIAIFTSPTWPQGDYILVAAISGTDVKTNATITLQAVYISIIVPQPAYPLGSRVVVYARVTMGGAPYPG